MELVYAVAIVLVLLVVYAILYSYRVGRYKKQLSIYERENKKLAWENETLKKELERIKHTLKECKEKLADVQSKAGFSESPGQKLSAVRILVENGSITEADLREVKQFLEKDQTGMSVEDALLAKEIVDSETMDKAKEELQKLKALRDE